MDSNINRINGIKYNWQLPNIEREQVLDIAGSYNISFCVIQALFNRGYNSKDSLDSYLFTSFEKERIRSEKERIQENIKKEGDSIHEHSTSNTK